MYRTMRSLLKELSRQARRIVLLTLPPIPKIQLRPDHWERIQSFNTFLKSLEGVFCLLWSQQRLEPYPLTDSNQFRIYPVCCLHIFHIVCNMGLLCLCKWWFVASLLFWYQVSTWKWVSLNCGAHNPHNQTLNVSVLCETCVQPLIKWCIH